MKQVQHATGRSDRRRGLTAAQVVVVLLAGLLAPIGAAGVSHAAPPPPTPSVSAVDAGADYFEENWSDGLDYANPEDMNTQPMTPSEVSGFNGHGLVAGPGLYNGSVANGVASFSAEVGAWYDLAPYVEGALHIRKFDAAAKPINADRYKRFQARIYASADTLSALFWFPAAGSPNKGVEFISLHAGWQTIDLPITNIQGDSAWAGMLDGLRYYPNFSSGGPVSFQFDWVRFATPSSNVTVGVGAAGAVSWDTDQNPGNNAGMNTQFASPTGAGNVTFPASSLGPGTYYVYQTNGTGTTYSTPITVHPQPLPVILDPDVTGGEDFATAVRHDAWDFSQQTDLFSCYSCNGVVNTSAGVLNGSPAGPELGDPRVALPLAGPIDATKYHHLSFRAGYAGTWGLAGAPGGGMVARFIWSVPDGIGGETHSDSDDIVVYPGDFETVSVDLKTSPPGAINDPDAVNRLGWGGPASQQITGLRFDPHEDPGGRSWALDYVTLAANDRGAPRFDVRFQDKGWKPGTTADIFVDSDNSGYNGTKIANAISVSAGVNTFNWGLQDHLGNALPPGTYWVYIVLHDPLGGSGQSYSTGQVDMPAQPASPPGVPQNLTAVAGVEQATVSWSPPASSGSAPISNYRVTVNPGGGQLTVPAATTSTVVTGLTGGVAYTFSVVALNSGGAGPPAGPTAAVTPTALPGTKFHPVVPYRVLDSRTATGGWNGAKLGAGQSRELVVRGAGGGSPVPADASAVVLNVTATDGTLPSFATVYPAGAVRPSPSNLNFGAGQTIPNLVTAKIGARDSVSVFNANGEAHFVADVVGYYDNGGADDGDLFRGITPKRLLDSRGATGGFNGAVGAGDANVKHLVVKGSDTTVPATATAVILNVTATQSSTNSFLRVWPKGAAPPNSSNLNFGKGQTIPNLVVVQIGADDSVSIFNAAGTTHVVADVMGYFDPTAGGGYFHSMAPVRVLDDRVPIGLAGPWGPTPPQPARALQVTGANGIPSGATGVVMNTTVTNPSAGSYLQVYPQGGAVPIATNLNYGPGQTIPNLVMTQLPANGQVSIANLLGSVDVIGDVSGYFAAS
jgi:hypothetical protein